MLRRRRRRRLGRERRACGGGRLEVCARFGGGEIAQLRGELRRRLGRLRRLGCLRGGGGRVRKRHRFGSGLVVHHVGADRVVLAGDLHQRRAARGIERLRDHVAAAAVNDAAAKKTTTNAMLVASLCARNGRRFAGCSSESSSTGSGAGFHSRFVSVQSSHLAHGGQRAEVRRPSRSERRARLGQPASEIRRSYPSRFRSL